MKIPKWLQLGRANEQDNRFSPLEERLIAAVRSVLPPGAGATFDAQVAGITLIQRLPPHSTQILFYRKRNGKVDWSGIPTFPRTEEFPLAEVRFSAEGRRFKATLYSINGHIFDFGITPSPKAVAFASWDGPPSALLLADPLTVASGRAEEPIPAVWQEFIAKHPQPRTGDWTFHDVHTAHRITLDEGEFLILAEQNGDQFIMARIEPSASGLFFLASHDGTPEPIMTAIDDVL